MPPNARKSVAPPKATAKRTGSTSSQKSRPSSKPSILETTDATAATGATAAATATPESTVADLFDLVNTKPDPMPSTVAKMFADDSDLRPVAPSSVTGISASNPAQENRGSSVGGAGTISTSDQGNRKVSAGAVPNPEHEKRGVSGGSLTTSIQGKKGMPVTPVSPLAKKQDVPKAKSTEILSSGDGFEESKQAVALEESSTPPTSKAEEPRRVEQPQVIDEHQQLVNARKELKAARAEVEALKQRLSQEAIEFQKGTSWLRLKLTGRVETFKNLWVSLRLDSDSAMLFQLLVHMWRELSIRTRSEKVASAQKIKYDTTCFSFAQLVADAKTRHKLFVPFQRCFVAWSTATTLKMVSMMQELQSLEKGFVHSAPKVKRLRRWILPTKLSQYLTWGDKALIFHIWYSDLRRAKIARSHLVQMDALWTSVSERKVLEQGRAEQKEANGLMRFVIIVWHVVARSIREMKVIEKLANEEIEAGARTNRFRMVARIRQLRGCAVALLMRQNKMSTLYLVWQFWWNAKRQFKKEDVERGKLETDCKELRHKLGTFSELRDRISTYCFGKKGIIRKLDFALGLYAWRLAMVNEQRAGYGAVKLQNETLKADNSRLTRKVEVMQREYELGKEKFVSLQQSVGAPASATASKAGAPGTAAVAAPDPLP